MLKQWLLISVMLFTSSAYSLDLELTQGVNSAMPIGIDSFGSPGAGNELTEVISHDLRLCGQFNVIPTPAATSRTVSLWKQAGADSVLIGSVLPAGSNQYTINYKLLDAAAHGNLLSSGTFTINHSELRALGHHISDLVYEKLTGVRGIFSTRIAYILAERSPKGQRYSLEIADVDGSSPRSLLVSTESIMSPAWSPDGRKIAYVSFEKKKAQIFVVEVATGKRQLITNFNGINGAPAWSPNGRELALVLSKGGSPKIYTVNLDSAQLKQVTFGDAIDTEPRYSPDGQSILFTSGRGGSPQIYSLSLKDGVINRLTYSGNYNARASYTGDQKAIVMMHRDEERHFSIAVQDMATSQLTPITHSDADESPSIAPNGRFVVYATHYHDKGVLSLVSIDGNVQLRLPERNGDIQEPAWSPYFG